MNDCNKDLQLFTLNAWIYVSSPNMNFKLLHKLHTLNVQILDHNPFITKLGWFVPHILFSQQITLFLQVY